MIPILFFNALQTNNKIVTADIFIQYLAQVTSVTVMKEKVTFSYVILLAGFVSKQN